MILIAFSASLVFSIGVVIGYYGKEGEIIPTSCAKGLGESSESHRDKGWVNATYVWYLQKKRNLRFTMFDFKVGNERVFEFWSTVCESGIHSGLP